MTLQLAVTLGCFFITVGTLVWRLAALHQQCMFNKESVSKAHERINKLEDVQNNKITELTNHIQVVKENQIRMEEKINLIIKYENKKTDKGRDI